VHFIDGGHGKVALMGMHTLIELPNFCVGSKIKELTNFCLLIVLCNFMVEHYSKAVNFVHIFL
jgi:hypothetical protein